MLTKTLFVNRQFFTRLYMCYHKKCNIRWLSNERSTKLVSLTNRGVIQVSGKDSGKLLQGLITNDLDLLTKDNSSMYTMVLNINGRIVYDLIVYKGTQENEYLIECDRIADDGFIELMKKYKLRSKVFFDKRPDLNIFCIFNSVGITEEDKLKLLNNEKCFEDTRLTQCGFRVLENTSESSFMESLDLNSIKIANLKEYDEHRFRMGISEGIGELSNGIPLEHNLAWLNGVSFNKGCYIGQELVARTHHVGVIRKRIMPLEFYSEISENISSENVINEKGKKVGKILGNYGKLGIGLMRLKEVGNTDSQLHVNVNETNIVVTSRKPDWWPSLQE